MQPELPVDNPVPSHRLCCSQTRLMEVHDRGGVSGGGAPVGGVGGDAVSSLCLGQQGGVLLLLVGHASGMLRVWEFKSHLTGV
jgi:hypothetical protein